MSVVVSCDTEWCEVKRQHEHIETADAGETVVPMLEWDAADLVEVAEDLVSGFYDDGDASDDHQSDVLVSLAEVRAIRGLAAAYRRSLKEGPS